MQASDNPVFVMDSSQPIEIAREALRRLAAQRIPPTPDNYRALYHEIAGTRAAEPFPVRALRQIAVSLPRTTRAEQEAAEHFAAAVEHHSWAALSASLADAMRNRCDAPVQNSTIDGIPVGPPLPTAAAASDETLLRDVLAEVFERIVPTLLDDQPKLGEQARRLAAELRTAETALPQMKATLHEFLTRAQLAADDQVEVRESLLSLLQLLLENVAHLVNDDRWLSGQVSVMRELLGKRLDARLLE